MRVKGLGLRVRGSEFRVEVLGSRIIGFRGYGLGFRV